MCECMTQIKEKMIKEGNYKGRKIVNVLFPDGLASIGNELRVIYYLIAELNVEGLKRKIDYACIMNYCPFCGEKYKEVRK